MWVTGLPGGRLFQYFVLGFSNPVTRRDYTRAADNTSHDLWFRLLASQRLPFYNFLIQSLFHMGRSVDSQIMVRNSVAEMKGLSKVGRVLFSRLGMLLSERTYQRRLLDLDAEVAAKLKYDPPVCVVMNFPLTHVSGFKFDIRT
jgi:hypothetical protein